MWPPELEQNVPQVSGIMRSPHILEGKHYSIFLSLCKVHMLETSWLCMVVKSCFRFDLNAHRYLEMNTSASTV